MHPIAHDTHKHAAPKSTKHKPAGHWRLRQQKMQPPQTDWILLSSASFTCRATQIAMRVTAHDCLRVSTVTMSKAQTALLVSAQLQLQYIERAAVLKGHDCVRNALIETEIAVFHVSNDAA